MPIPKEILSVERPKNTIVIAYGKEKNRYAVRKRVGCKNINGRHVPVNGPTIGHIVNGKYVPIENELPCVSQSAVDLKDWANYTLCDSLFKDIMMDLLQHYNYQDALKICCISIIKVCYPGTKDCEVQYRYEESFLSELYPGIALSRNTVSILMNDLGKTCSRIVEFMRTRTKRVDQDHCLLIDGVLKTDDSKVSTLSNFSRKARVKGEREISVLFAFDLNLMEPICSKCFPGNMIDTRAYENFILENGITKGLIVADKGFPASAAKKEFSANPGLHYLNPIKRNSKFIQTHHLLDFEALLSGEEGITYKKVKCKGVNKWLYAFRDSSKAAKEEKDYLRRAKKDGTYDHAIFKERQKSFGVIIFECDLDLDPWIIFKAYGCRWEIEVVAKYYKSACEFDVTNVHDDYSVIGREFCNFLSTLLTFRLINKFNKVAILENITYGNVMDVLARAKKIKIKGEWELIRINVGQVEILQELGLLPQAPNSKSCRPAKRGRPSKKMI